MCGLDGYHTMVHLSRLVSHGRKRGAQTKTKKNYRDEKVYFFFQKPTAENEFSRVLQRPPSLGLPTMIRYFCKRRALGTEQGWALNVEAQTLQSSVPSLTVFFAAHPYPTGTPSERRLRR